MNKFISLVLAFITTTLPLCAQNSSNNSSSNPIELEMHGSLKSSAGTHRVPARIDIYASYNIEEGLLEIYYDGDADGEVFLYLNGDFFGYDSEINTSFQISDPGLYKIEIVSDTWIATGSFRL